MAGNRTNRGAAMARGVGVALMLSFQLTVSVLLGYLLGHWLDGLTNDGPWLSVTGVLIGVGAGFFGIYHLSRVLMK